MAERAPWGNRPGALGLEFEARLVQRRQTVEALGSGRTALQVIAVARGAEDVMESLCARAEALQPPRPPLACQEGCAWCCRKMVGTAAPEVERILDHVRAHASTSELEALRARALALVEARRALKEDRPQAGKLPCVFLENERCSIYAVRPLTCRGFTSSDARACERSYRERRRVPVPVYEPRLRIATFTLDGMRAGLQESGLSGELLELASAVHVALDDPDAFARWRAGEPVFAAARLP